MSALATDDFVPFVREVSGFDPFPWQRRLLTAVLDHGWPALLDLPTGTGKTTTVLIALFALAVDPARFHRRIALVVDRRIIVDQVDEYARRIRTALDDATRPACQRVARRLQALASRPDAAPVRVVQLRGGIPRDDAWLGTPDQPTIIASTVDQVGSRLLFRGYGVSEGMRPVHAGVLGRDTLYLLDEVHLATAFEETLARLQDTYGAWAERGGTGRPLTVVRMSATPRTAAQASAAASVTAFGLDDEDLRHPVLARRLEVSRRARLVLVKTKRATDAAGRAQTHARIATAAGEHATEALGAGARAVGIVVNRVDTARRAARLLRERDDVDVLLLTGRMRAFDKARIQQQVTTAVGSGADLDQAARPTVVVATSCIEAGADLDFDALITEVASLDALRQRFGRLDRLGAHDQTWAFILGRSDQLGDRSDDDPVYGPALRNTWSYLQTIAQDDHVDFGLRALPVPEPERLATLLPPSPQAPVLFPRYLDLWSETRPAPYPDPDPALWLHGKGQQEPRDVHLVFRADLPAAAVDDEPGLERAREAIEWLPPVADEAVDVPLPQVRSWRDGQPTWRWTAQGLERVNDPDQLRPGDTLIVDAERGGLFEGTWDPGATEPVPDVAELSTWSARGHARLRLDAAVLPPALRAGCPTPPRGDDDPEAFELARAQCHRWLDGLGGRGSVEADERWRPLLQALATAGRDRRLMLGTNAAGEPTWTVAVLSSTRAAEATTEDVVSVFTGIEVSLPEHLADVRAWAHAFATAAGLDSAIADDVALAALLHDLGKADPRFQAMLRGGDPIATAAGPALAKSRQFGSAAARQRAQDRSGWPPGLRHELVSLALLDASEPLRARAHDLDLVRHLVASHHGWCRPWIPALIDPEPTLVRVRVDDIETEVSTAAIDDDFGVECAARFHRLCRRYGWHGLAYLEALLRLGDHRASAVPGARPEASP